MMYYEERKKIVTECIIDGERIEYDACSGNSLESAKAFYGARFNYIGSGNVIYINGVENRLDKTYHFFTRA